MTQPTSTDQISLLTPSLTHSARCKAGKALLFDLNLLTKVSSLLDQLATFYKYVFCCGPLWQPQSLIVIGTNTSEIECYKWIQNCPLYNPKPKATSSCSPARINTFSRKRKSYTASQVSAITYPLSPEWSEISKQCKMLNIQQTFHIKSATSVTPRWVHPDALECWLNISNYLPPREPIKFNWPTSEALPSLVRS